jgi:XrtJ-associated TM-motif-TM protein
LDGPTGVKRVAILGLTLAIWVSIFFAGGIIMKKSLQVLFWSAAILAVALPAHAQSGCTDSPENPTAVLALVGSAAGFISTLRARAKARGR